jgi:hypothetical protein
MRQFAHPDLLEGHASENLASDRVIDSMQVEL